MTRPTGEDEMSNETKAPQPPAEAQRCTCPSGDGSLRWPCPAHPAEAQADEVVCLECGQPTMHMGQVCYACSHPAAKPAEAQPCGCGEATCTVPWEPGCGLGKSEQHAEAQAQDIGPEWKPCRKRPVVVHVREQRPDEQHVSTREGITAVKPDDLIMRGVEGEEYPIGRELFAKTYDLVEAQAQDGGEVFGWVLGDAFVDARFWTAGTPPQGWTPVYRTAPPSAPVGLEWLSELSDDELRIIFYADPKLVTRLKAALAQQPAADGGFTAADMMDARQEGRKEAQQPAAVDGVCKGTHCCPACGRCCDCHRPVLDCLAGQQGGAK